jgi:pimeloyl-ACP methyl ester carboxylesterase
MRNTAFLCDGLSLNVVEGELGTPVIFQHGLCGSAAQTAEAFPDDPRFRLVTLECRGQGASPAGDEKRFSIKTFAEDLASLIEERELSPCVIGGISMGAAIATRLAVTRPELVKALIIARPAWVAAAAPQNCAPNVEVGELLSRLPPKEAKAAFLRGETARRLERLAPDNLNSLSGFFSREPAHVTAALLTHIAGDGPAITEDQLSDLRIPTLIIATDQDVIHPIAHAERLHALIPGATLRTIAPKAVDKALYLSEFRATLLTFLEDHAR